MNPQDPDFRYLGVDRKKLIAEAKPFDGKKACWIPDEKEGYVKGEIMSTTGDDVKVLTEKMEVGTRATDSSLFVDGGGPIFDNPGRCRN